MKLNQLKQHIYSPYSSHNGEWCVVTGDSGTAYPGVRVENISFPLTITSMHGAICSCLGNGDHPDSFYSETQDEELQTYWVEQYNLNRLPHPPDAINLYNPFMEEAGKPSDLLRDFINDAVTTHSGFPVSALLYTEKGIVPGVNVEVDSWALGLCAERLALFRAITSGAASFIKLKVYAPKGDFSSPCGACRQVLMEWMPDKDVELHHGDNTLSTHKIMHLLPYAFSSGKLIK
ncbi:hypothetical protein BH23BAC3_BH23BAC3_15610 [soil metagenome]